LGVSESAANYIFHQESKIFREQLPAYIMSDRLTIISRSGRVFEMVNYWQVLWVNPPPTKIAVARPDMILFIINGKKNDSEWQ
jgi:hypothetical protein